MTAQPGAELTNIGLHNSTQHTLMAAAKELNEFTTLHGLD
jgi:hypothetical protein